jgi:hypothetical protein
VEKEKNMTNVTSIPGLVIAREWIELDHTPWDGDPLKSEWGSVKILFDKDRPDRDEFMASAER